MQTPGAPTLTIFLTATNTAIISWAAPSTGFVLQQNESLAAPTWIAPSEPINNDGTNKFMIVNPSTRSRFYRLIRP